jgi:uncharacterized membrane protein YphA (DoxX/SURF4 family)
MSVIIDYAALALRIGLGLGLMGRSRPVFKKKGVSLLYALLQWIMGLLVLLGVFIKPVLIITFVILIGTIIYKIKSKLKFASTVHKPGWDIDFVLLMVSIALYIFGPGSVVVGW